VFTKSSIGENGNIRDLLIKRNYLYIYVVITLLSSVCYRLSSMHTVSTIFQLEINLQNSSSQDVVMASSLDAFRRGLDKFENHCSRLLIRGISIFSVSYFCAGIIMCVCGLQVSVTKKS